MMKIVVTGSLGNVGKPLAESLVQKGHSVTVVSSDPSRRAAIEALGATAAIGSLSDADFLTHAFTGAAAVHCMVPPNFAEADPVAYYRRVAGNYAHAIGHAAVARVVHLSSYGAHLDHGTGFVLGSHHAERVLNEMSGVAITHLRPAFFYNNLYGFADMIRQAGFIGANYGGGDRLVMVHPRDIAVAASAALEASVTGTDVRYVASVETTAADVAHVLGAAIGKPELKWITFTDEQMQKALLDRGLPPHVVTNLVEMGAATHSGRIREDYEQHRPVIIGTVTLQAFAREFAAVF